MNIDDIYDQSVKQYKVSQRILEELVLIRQELERQGQEIIEISQEPGRKWPPEDGL